MALIQYDLFETRPSEVDVLKLELKEVRESTNKVRKGLFARHNELAKMYVDVVQRMDVIERNICRK